MELKQVPPQSKHDNDGHEQLRRQQPRQWNSDAQAAPDYTLLCGLGSWRPAWLQKLANRYVYSLAFILIGIAQGMSWTYFNGIVTTVEKAFHVDSSTMGIIMTGNDISQILCGLILTYVASRGNKPFWMAIGILIGAMASFTYASTQLLWKPDSRTADLPIHQYSNTTSASSVSLATTAAAVLCSAGVSNATIFADGQCETTGSRSNMAAAAWLFFGQFVAGIGGTTTYSVGFSYMDDNIKKRNSPFYIGLTSAMRALGPMLGYFLASYCLRIHIIPSDVPNYESSDPRWLGAWWLGFLIIGILQTVFAIPILLFPKVMPSRTRQTGSTVKVLPKEEEKKFTFKDFLPTLKRLARNPIMVGDLVSMCTILIPVVGVNTFMPKYVEARFRQTASQANILTGLTSQLVISVGFFVGGAVIWKFKPRAVYIASYTAIADFIYAMGFLIIMNLDCNDVNMEGIAFNSGKPEVTSNCSAACDCDMTFDPVCVEGQNFLSPCMAGCTAANITTIMNVTKNIFHNCACGPSTSMSNAYGGFCKDPSGTTCPNLWIYMITIGVCKMIATNARIGCLMIIVRSVLKEDKGVALTLTSVVASIFAIIPAPIIYGAAVDSTCLLWETSCGHRGNCWLFDVQAFSSWFHGISVFFILVTIVADVYVAANCRQLDLYAEDPEDEESAAQDAQSMRESVFVSRTSSLKGGL